MNSVLLNINQTPLDSLSKESTMIAAQLRDNDAQKALYDTGLTWTTLTENRELSAAFADLEISLKLERF